MIEQFFLIYCKFFCQKERLLTFEHFEKKKMDSIAQQFLKLLTSKDVKKCSKYSVPAFSYTVSVLNQPNAKLTNHKKLTQIP